MQPADGTIRSLEENIAQVIVGKEEATRLLLIALLCEGHVLIEDVPGIGKTLLAKTLAASLDCSFRRLQFTPDMLPSDITGSHVFNQATAQFEFRPGPVFAHIVLADEINRATPRTQSALLEAMEERQVSVDGVTMALPRPFLVAATQNPIELEGTFPLPEAQLDRFLLKVTMGYPSFEDEVAILDRFAGAANAAIDANSSSADPAEHNPDASTDPLSSLQPVADAAAVQSWQTQRRSVRLEPEVKEYLLRLVRATREHEDVALGASPRAALALYRATQARALLEGRDYVAPDDVKRLAAPVLAHRLVLSAAARLHGASAETVIASVGQTLAVPVEVE